MFPENDDATHQQVDDAQIQDGAVGEATEKPEATDLRGLLKSAVEEHRETPEKSAARAEAAAQRKRDDAGRFAKEKAEREAREKADKTAAAKESKPDGAVEKPATEAKPVSETTEVKEPPAVSPQPAGDPPTSWSKEAKAEWSKLSPATQQAVLKREKEIVDGIAGYKARYDGIEQVIAPVRPHLQQRGISEAAAIKSAFDWHFALAGPHGGEVLKQLAAAHNIDIATLFPSSNGGSQEGESPQQVQLPPQVVNLIRGLQQEIAELKGGFGNLQGTVQQTQADRINSTIQDFAKDKPHFESVRVLMGQLINSGAAESLDDAYQKAVWASPEVRAAMQQEEAAKRDAADKAAAAAKAEADREAEAKRKKEAAEAAARARRAAVSVHGSAPNGGAAPQKLAKAKSVRDSISEAIQEAQG